MALKIPKFLFLVTLIVTVTSCHYTCSACITQDYYMCTACNPFRGNSLFPINGMCYCDNDSDEDALGTCEQSQSYNVANKTLIVVFISLSLFFSLATTIIKGMRYFLYKTIEDVQELSLIVFINLYFPQQFDVFLTELYRFNISSYTFESLTIGSLFAIQSDNTVNIADGESIYGKYRLLHKTANFFGNQFTWLLVFVSLLIFAVAVKILRNWLKKKRQYQIIRTQIIKHENIRQNEHNVSQADLYNEMNQSINSIQEITKIQKKRAPLDKSTFYFYVNKLYNMLWLNFAIAFFYFSIIELNINIFTQIGNLTFSSNFATTGAFFSAVFLAIQIVLLALLFLKSKEEMIKPEWMRDYAYSPAIYLIRTNFKTITKYFWFISCIKKVLLAMMITLLYSDPVSAIVGISTVHGIYLLIAIYCEPFQRKYIRIHFYITEALKMFMFFCLLDFATKYADFVQLIDLTQIFYTMLSFIFGFHLSFILINIIVERKVYWRFIQKRCCKKQHQQEHAEKRIGYRGNSKLYIYQRQ